MPARPFRILTLVPLGLALLAGSSALAVDPAEADREARAIANEMMSPFCPGRTLQACPSPAAGDLRREIRDQLGEGATRDEVVTALVAQYGDAMRGSPETPWSWAVPAGVLALGAVAVAFWIRRSARAPAATDAERAPADAPAEPDPSELDGLLDRELDALG